MVRWGCVAARQAPLIWPRHPLESGVGAGRSALKAGGSVLAAALSPIRMYSEHEEGAYE